AIGGKCDLRAMVVQRIADAEPAGARRRMERPAPERLGVSGTLDAQHSSSRLAGEIQRHRRWFPRRHGIRAASWLPPGERLYRVDRASKRVRVAGASVR